MHSTFEISKQSPLIWTQNNCICGCNSVTIKIPSGIIKWLLGIIRVNKFRIGWAMADVTMYVEAVGQPWIPQPLNITIKHENCKNKKKNKKTLDWDIIELEWEWVGVSILHLSTILALNFGNVPTVWYFLFFIIVLYTSLTTMTITMLMGTPWTPWSRYYRLHM